MILYKLGFFSHHILYALVLSFALHKQCIIQKLKRRRYILFQILFAVVQLKCLKVYAESNKKCMFQVCEIIPKYLMTNEMYHRSGTGKGNLNICVFWATIIFS